MLSFFPRADALGVVLPSNSPGVHSLWAPATVLKMPLVLKPGSAEPWTPLRMIQAWIKAGAPAEVFGYYPADHAGGNEILRSCGRGMVFGDVGSTKRWKADPRVEVHGPGFSKIVIGPDVADDWERYLDVMVESIANNGGRSCVNASGVWVTKHADRIAEALAERLAAMTPRPAEDPEAVLAPFADPVDRAAHLGGDRSGHGRRRGRSARLTMRRRARARRRTRRHRSRRHLPAADGHPLRRGASARQSRVPVPVRQRRRSAGRRVAAILGPSLVVTCLSDDQRFRERFVASPHVDRLNSGRSRRRRSDGISRTRATCSIICTLAGRSSGSRERQVASYKVTSSNRILT